MFFGSVFATASNVAAAGAAASWAAFAAAADCSPESPALHNSPVEPVGLVGQWG